MGMEAEGEIRRVVERVLDDRLGPDCEKLRSQVANAVLRDIENRLDKLDRQLQEQGYAVRRVESQLESEQKLVTMRMDEIGRTLNEVKDKIDQHNTATPLQIQEVQLRITALETSRDGKSTFWQGALLQIIPGLFGALGTMVAWIIIQMNNGGITP